MVMGLFDRSKKSGPAAQQEVTIQENRDVSATDVPEQLPVLPLKDTVIYPHTLIPVYVESPTSIAALQAAQETDGMVASFILEEALISTDEGNAEESSSAKATEDKRGKKKEKAATQQINQQMIAGQQKAGKAAKDVTPEDLHAVGTACLVHQMMPVSGSGGVMAILQGVIKIEALEFWGASPETKAQGPMMAVVEPVEDEVKKGKNLNALKKATLKSAQEIVQNTPHLPQELSVALADVKEPLKFVYLVASLVKFSPGERQEILEKPSAAGKLKFMAGILDRELEELKLGEKITSNVKKEFSDRSREAYLRQQLKEIRKELGEDNEGEQLANEYRKKLEKAKEKKTMSKKAVKEVERELGRLESIHPHSQEFQVIRDYLEWVFEVPWEKQTKDNLDLKRAQIVLDEDHHGLKDIKERITEYLAVRKLKKDPKGAILCFVGPPGVGKTSLGKSVARTLKREFVRMSLGGMRDEAEIRGHRRTYIGAMPGRIIQGLRRAGSKNPVFMLDEIDKVGSDQRGDPSSALLEVLDPEQNDTFRDHYLDLEFDLSKILFIATANILETVHPALKDRMEIIQLPGYTDEEKVRIGYEYLWPRVLKEHGLNKGKVRLDEQQLPLIISEYTREAGVRKLEQRLAKIARKSAHKIARGEQKSITINKKRVRKFLGPQKVYPEHKRRTAQPGVVTGLSVTQAGGDILFIEANKMPGKKKFNLTGQLGDVMKESANTALSLVRSRAGELDIETDFFEKSDLHLHVPQGAVPKDGPSAGIAMTTAIASLLTETAVKNNIAMTGEITLSGLVLPIGGVKEKVLAAKRAEIASVILPKRNQNDVSEIEDDLLEGLNFHYVENIDEVLELALDKS